MRRGGMLRCGARGGGKETPGRHGPRTQPLAASSLVVSRHVKDSRGRGQRQTPHGLPLVALPRRCKSYHTISVARSRIANVLRSSPNSANPSTRKCWNKDNARQPSASTRSSRRRRSDRPRWYVESSKKKTRNMWHTHPRPDRPQLDQARNHLLYPRPPRNPHPPRLPRANLRPDPLPQPARAWHIHPS